MCNGRRKLVLGEGDLLAAVEPRFERRISIELGTPHRISLWIFRLAVRKPLGLDDLSTARSDSSLLSA